MGWVRAAVVNKDKLCSISISLHIVYSFVLFYDYLKSTSFPFLSSALE